MSWLSKKKDNTVVTTALPQRREQFKVVLLIHQSK